MLSDRSRGVVDVDGSVRLGKKEVCLSQHTLVHSMLVLILNASTSHACWSWCTKKTNHIGEADPPKNLFSII